MSITQITPVEQSLMVALHNTTEVLKQVTAERDALRADAERYRYLRDAETIDQWIWDALEHTDGDDREAYQKGLDAAVDQAMKGKS